MADIETRRCGHEDCSKHPTICDVGSKAAWYCRQPAEDSSVAVTSKRYGDEGCNRGLGCKAASRR